MTEMEKWNEAMTEARASIVENVGLGQSAPVAFHLALVALAAWLDPNDSPTSGVLELRDFAEAQVGRLHEARLKAREGTADTL